jgi:hypothetical protein
VLFTLTFSKEYPIVSVIVLFELTLPFTLPLYVFVEMIGLGESVLPMLPILLILLMLCCPEGLSRFWCFLWPLRGIASCLSSFLKKGVYSSSAMVILFSSLISKHFIIASLKSYDSSAFIEEYEIGVRISFLKSDSLTQRENGVSPWTS